MAVPSTDVEREALSVDVLRHHKERIASLGSRHRIVSSSIASIDHNAETVTITTVYTLAKSDAKDIPNVEGLATGLPGEAGNPSLVTP